PVQIQIGEARLEVVNEFGELRLDAGRADTRVNPHIEEDFSHRAGECRTLDLTATHTGNPAVGLNHAAGVALGVLQNPLLQLLNHRGSRDHRAAKTRNVVRHAGITEGALDLELEPGHARLLVVHPVPRLHDDGEIRVHAAVEHVDDTVGHAGVALADIHRHAAVSHAHQQVTLDRHSGLNQRGGHFSQGGNHGFRVGGSQPEDPVIHLLSKGLQVGFLAISDKDFFARRAIQVGIDGCIQQHRGAAAAALVLTQGIAGDVVHRVVARLHADGLQVTAHEFAGRTGGTGGAVNIGQVEQQFLQTLWIETSTSLLVPLTLFGTERNLSSWFHARLLNYWQQTAR